MQQIKLLLFSSLRFQFTSLRLSARQTSNANFHLYQVRTGEQVSNYLYLSNQQTLIERHECFLYSNMMRGAKQTGKCIFPSKAETLRVSVSIFMMIRLIFYLVFPHLTSQQLSLRPSCSDTTRIGLVFTHPIQDQAQARAVSGRLADWPLTSDLLICSPPITSNLFAASQSAR